MLRKKGEGEGPALRSQYDYSCDLWAAAACGDVAAILSALRHGAKISSKQKKVPLSRVLSTAARHAGIV